MNQEFNQLFTARLLELTKDLRLYHRPSGELVAPKVVMTMLPPKTVGWQEGNDFPIICWTHHRGELSHLEPRPFEVVVDCGLMIDANSGTAMEQIIQGTEGVQAIISALHPLAGSRLFGPFKLQLPFSYTIGDNSAGSEGRQPHPYYWVRFNLSFVARLSGRRN